MNGNWDNTDLGREAARSAVADNDWANYLDTQARNATDQYNTAYGTAQSSQQQLQDFAKNIRSGSDVYSEQLTAANRNAGYDVNALNQAQKQVSQLTGIIGGLPRAVQASNANYGATAGNVANQVATTGANLNQSLSLANQNAANQLLKQQAGLTGAQQGTTAFIQTQDQQRQGYEAAAQNAAQIMQNAQATMQSLINAATNGRQLTAQNQATFAQARASYAAAQQAYAVAQYNLAQAEQTRYQTQQQRAADDRKRAAEEAAKASGRSTLPAASTLNPQQSADQDAINAALYNLNQSRSGNFGSQVSGNLGIVGGLLSNLVGAGGYSWDQLMKAGKLY